MTSSIRILIFWKSQNLDCIAFVLHFLNMVIYSKEGSGNKRILIVIVISYFASDTKFDGPVAVKSTTEPLN
jgi:hypothetical protein